MADKDDFILKTLVKFKYICEDKSELTPCGG